MCGLGILLTFSRRKSERSIVARKALTFLVLALFCAASVPIPIATVSLDKDSTEAFPCQDSPCACKSARECWTSCCCRSPKERMAWAVEHGVQPPDYAVLSDDINSSDPLALVSESQSASVVLKSCCSKRVDANVCSNEAAATHNKKSCCAKSVALKPTEPLSTAHDGSSRLTGKRSTSRKIVTTLSMRKCQGSSSDFTLLPWTILVPIKSFCIEAAKVEALYCAGAPRPFDVGVEPATPPPRFDSESKDM